MKPYYLLGWGTESSYSHSNSSFYLQKYSQQWLLAVKIIHNTVWVADVKVTGVSCSFLQSDSYFVYVVMETRTERNTIIAYRWLL